MLDLERKIIVNGDDGRKNRGIDKGISAAYDEGILTSVTMLGNGILDAELFRKLTGRLDKPPIGIGVHLNLTAGEPLLLGWRFAEFTRPYKGSNSKKEWLGSSWKDYFSTFEVKQVRAEFDAQIRNVVEAFGSVDHIDSHHSVASYPPITQVYEEVARRHSLPLRHIAPMSDDIGKVIYGGRFEVVDGYAKDVRGKGLKTVDRVNMDFFSITEKDPISAFCRKLDKIKPGETWEFMFHPSSNNSDGDWRRKDLKLLTSDKVKKAIKDSGIKLTTYGESAR